jgi:hypothetical protein
MNDEQLEIVRVPIEEAITAEVLSLTCTEEEDGTMLIEWDETDPVAISLGINDWTEELWDELLRDACERATGVPCDKVSQDDSTQPSESAD